MIKGMSLLMLAVGIVLVIASCLLYAAGKASAPRAASRSRDAEIHHLLCRNGGVGAFGGQVFLSVNNTTANYFAGLIIGSVLAHIISEAIYSRGFKGLKKSFKAYGVFAVVFLIGYVSIVTPAFTATIPVSRRRPRWRAWTLYIPTGYISQGYSDTFSFNIRR